MNHREELDANQNNISSWESNFKNVGLKVLSDKNQGGSKVVSIASVLDLVSQVRDVVLVMCIFSSGKPHGVGILETGVYGEGDGNGEISLRAT